MLKESTINNKNKEVQIENDEHKLGIGETAVSFVSTIMGGGVVSVPYAYSTAGFRVGFCIQLVVMAAYLFTCRLYLEVRRRLRCESSFTAVA